MEITLYESDGVFEECSGCWRELLTDSDADQIFLTCEWQATWWRAYAPGKLFVLVVRDSTGRWMGIAPWFIDASETGRRIIRTVGCVDVTDYLDIVARRGHEIAVFEALATWLSEHMDAYDEILLCNIPQSSKALEHFPAIAEAHGLSTSVRLQEVCPVIQLPAQFSEYVGSLDKKNRHELRRKMRRAAGDVEWYIVGQEHDLSEHLEHFFTLMAASSDEKARFLEDPANRRFFECVVPKVAGQGWLQLSFLTVRGKPAAAYLNFVYNNRVLVYNSGLDPLNHGHLSPGIVLLGRLIEYAIQQGYEAFDFLRGDEAYKYDMGGRDTNVYQLQIAKDSST